MAQVPLKKKKKADWSDKNLELFLKVCIEEECPDVAKFRDQGLKFKHEMEFLFKGTVATGFAAYAPSEDSRESEGRSIGVEETTDDDDETEIEVNETKVGVTTQATSPATDLRQRKRGRQCEKRVGAATKLSSQLDRVIDNFESSSGGAANDPTSIGSCIEKLKNLPGLELGSDLFYIGIRLMNKRANRLAFIHLGEPALQLGWLHSHSWANVR
ncbi:putative L10-interacting MYB domain-containing protein-like [Sesbania bispinosa]|nr:putative L10-interacting MYB domain-containing protein-like [Sesbania bispinosa]